MMVNMRSQQPIGALLSAVKDEEEIYDEIYESWIHDRHVRICPVNTALQHRAHLHVSAC